MKSPAALSAPRPRKGTNLYLPVILTVQATTAANERYGLSLSALVEKMLQHELTLKGGLFPELRLSKPHARRNATA